MMEIYVPPFRNAVRSGVGSVMCSYNRVDGVHACENEEIMRVLKADLGFKGWVMSDWGAVHSTVGSANAGLDQEMPTGEYFSATALKSNITAGKVRALQCPSCDLRVPRWPRGKGQDCFPCFGGPRMAEGPLPDPELAFMHQHQHQHHAANPPCKGNGTRSGTHSIVRNICGSFCTRLECEVFQRNGPVAKSSLPPGPLLLLITGP